LLLQRSTSEGDLEPLSRISLSNRLANILG